MFSEALHADLIRLRLAPNKSLANVQKMPLQYENNKTYIQATRIVRFPEFYEKAARVFWSIADALRVLPKQANLFVFVQEDKSNEWLAALFVDYLKRVGSDDLISRLVFSDFPEDTSNTVAIFLDDGMYSGKQMADDFLHYILPHMDHSMVIVGVPFVTDVALKKVEQELKRHSDRLASIILYSDIMQPMSKDPKSPYMQPAIYFDHKVPDIVSTYAEVYDRYLDPNTTKPFYKNKSLNWKKGLMYEPTSNGRPRVPLNASAIPRASVVIVDQGNLI